MAELDEELWKLGVLAKTEHNEVAPGQHELAPIYSTTNIATDQNQITMEVMQNVAARHDLVCLLHEKPFEGVNGSGKHNNWSIDTDDGIHLLRPGASPHDNAQFLLFLAAVIQAVDDYQDLLRVSVATAGNDHRLGTHEAPPAIVSVYLGKELTDILKSIENDAPYSSAGRREMEFGVPALPAFSGDTADRNRTSPFAFTGNKFEFRMLGSSNSIACANIMLNAAVAESLRQYADLLESAPDFKVALHDLLKKVIKQHKRIIFNGNGYSAEWIAEAERRGLSNLPSTPDCMPRMLEKKNVEMLTRLGVFSEAEIHSRYEILLGNYVNIVNIEAATMLDMARRGFMPAISAFSSEMAESMGNKAKYNIDYTYEKKTADELSGLLTGIMNCTEKLAECAGGVAAAGDITAQSIYIRDKVLPAMSALRELVDKAETITDRYDWPYPSYAHLMFDV